MLVKNWTTGEVKECDTRVYSTDMDVLCECPECGKKVPYGNLYNAGDWFEPKGIWRVCICEECMNKIYDKNK